MRFDLIVMDVLQFVKVPFGDMWMRMAILFQKSVVGQENQDCLIVMQNHSAMGGQKFMMREHRMNTTI